MFVLGSGNKIAIVLCWKFNKWAVWCWKISHNTHLNMGPTDTDGGNQLFI